ncbi:hypothetical protein JNUCC83_12040 [Vagococcus sp. JNUCC 83]
MILLATIHDPYGKLVQSLKANKQMLNNIFSDIYLCVSHETDISLIEEIQQSFLHVSIIPKNGAADARRKVIFYGLTTKEVNTSFLYCDFDRVLTWLATNPSELRELVDDRSSYDYTILGRTDEAFTSHPISWQETEKITNDVASKFFCLENLDVTAGAAIMSKNAATLIAMNSNHSHTDCEWPKIITDKGGSLSHKKVNGLCFKRVNEVNESHGDDYMNRLKLALNILAVFN